MISLLLAASLAWSAEPMKVLVVVTEAPNPLNVGVALRQVKQLKDAGHQVELLFQGAGLVALADLSGVREKDKIKKKLEADEKKDLKQRSPLWMLAHRIPPMRPESRKLFQDLTKMGVTYKGDGFSADKLDLREDLTAAGVPLSGGAEPADLTPYLAGGWRVLSY